MVLLNCHTNLNNFALKQVCFCLWQKRISASHLFQVKKVCVTTINGVMRFWVCNSSLGLHTFYLGGITMKKGTCILLVYAILMTLLVVAPFTANANEKDVAETGGIIDSGTTGDCTWTLDDKGLLTISGRGRMEDNYHPWDSSYVTKVIINDGVTSIGNLAFSNCTKLMNIDIPASVKSIGYQAFFRCSGLTSIDIPYGVKSIGWSAFYRCTSLTSIDIPDTVTSIDADAFEDTAWYDNQPDGLVYAGKVAYQMKGPCPAHVDIKNGTVAIANNAFDGCTSLTSIDIPDSVTIIGGYAFEGCTGLTSIDIPDSVESIGASAFYGCTGISSVTIPATVTDIYEKAFGYYNKEGLGETKVKNFTIYGYTGSEAERYANDNSFNFVALDEPTDPTSTTKRDFFGDIDGDGKITVLDATAIQRYTAEIDTPYPIGDKIK